MLSHQGWQVEKISFSRSNSKHMEMKWHCPHNTYSKVWREHRDLLCDACMCRPWQTELWQPSQHHTWCNPSWHHPSRRTSTQGFFPYFEVCTAQRRELVQGILWQGRRAVPQTLILSGFPSLLFSFFFFFSFLFWALLIPTTHLSWRHSLQWCQSIKCGLN